MSHKSNDEKHLDAGSTSDYVSPQGSGPSSSAPSSDLGHDAGSKSEKFEQFSASPKDKDEIDDNSDQTVLSFSPPLEVLAASTIEHDAKSPFDSMMRTGMLPAGTQLAHFIVEKYIGGGGMGRVYLGIDQALDRKVALKVLPMQRVHDQASVARFMNEAKSAARLNHEHIAQVYFSGEQNGIPFIAFEYVRGTNVRTYVEEHGVLPLPQAINYLLQISHALAHAATHQVIHRDVKPSNILITTGGRAKLIDMGLARLLTHTNVDNDLTASGVTLGTFDYISPEQARDPRNADTRSDIYSLGCTFFFMLTGRPPFSEGTVLQKLLQHQGDVPPDVRDFQPNIPVQVSQIIQKMMAKDPRMRYQTASELVGDLTEVARMIGLRPVDSGSLVWHIPFKGRFRPVLRHLPWLIPLILFGLLFFFVRSGMFFAPQTGVVAPPIPINDPSVSRGNDPARRDPGVSPQVNTPTGTGDSPPLVLPKLVLHDTSAVGFPLSLSLGRLFDFVTTAPESPTETAGRQGLAASAIRIKPVSVALATEPVQAAFSPVVSASAAYRATALFQPKQAVPVSTGAEIALPARLVVDPTGEVTNSYKSLTDAARAAAKEATIELHSQTPIEIEHFRFSESKTTIKSAEGQRVKLVFRPSANASFTNTFSMAALTNSNLVFENVDIEMITSQSADVFADRWTMFDLVGLNTVELRNVVLTINNTQRDRAYQEKNAFFRCLPNSSVSYVVPPTATAARTTLKLTDCLIRGDASLLRSDSSRGVLVETDNVLLAINRPVFALLDIKPSSGVIGRNMITANFVHNTIYAPTMVAWQQGSSSGGTIGHSIELSLIDSIVRFNNIEATMADYGGGIAMLPDVSGFYSRSSQRTFYQNFASEWVIRPNQPGEMKWEGPPNESSEERQLMFDTVVWGNPIIGYIPLHELTKDSFLLDETSGRRNPALKSSLAGENAGINPELIPDVQ